MSIRRQDLLNTARMIFNEINAKYYSGRLPEYEFIEDNILSSAPKGAIAQIDGPSHVVHLAIQKFPYFENGTYSEEFLYSVVTHESIHAVMYEDEEADWASCASEGFKRWSQKVP